MGDTDKKLDPLDCTMSLGDHLEELRARLILALVGLTLGAIVALVFGKQIIRFIEKPYFSAMQGRVEQTEPEVADSNEVAFVKLFFTNMVTALDTDPNAPVLDAKHVNFFQQVSERTIRQWGGESEADEAKPAKNLPRYARLQVLGPAEAFISYMKVSFIAGLILTCPWVFYQLWMFVAAGLYERERHYVHSAVPFSAVLFVGGALFFLFVVAPLSLKFFLFFGDALGVASNWTLQRYISFVTLLMLVFGLAFQTPIAIFILVRTGLVSLETLRGARKYVFLGVFVIAAVTTPPDMISQITLAVPLYGLFELGMFLANLVGNKEAQKRFKAGLKLTGILILVGAIGWIFSGMINEYGHAVGAKLLGGTVTNVQPFVFLGSPDCTYEGDLSASREALITIAGLFACVLAGVLGLLAVPFRKLGALSGMCVAVFFTAPLAKSVEWIVFAILHMVGRSRPHEAIEFIQQSGFQPLIVAVIGVGMAVLAFRVFRWKTHFVAKIKAFFEHASRGA